LLSHRYGSFLAPAYLSERLFLSLKNNSTLNTDEKEILTQMYRCDENYADRRYYLQTIDDQDSDSSKEKQLQLLLRKAADSCYEQRLISDDERKEFFRSGMNTTKRINE
jgi:hypothetical protein